MHGYLRQSRGIGHPHFLSRDASGKQAVSGFVSRLPIREPYVQGSDCKAGKRVSYSCARLSRLRTVGYAESGGIYLQLR